MGVSIELLRHSSEKDRDETIKTLQASTTLKSLLLRYVETRMKELDLKALDENNFKEGSLGTLAFKVGQLKELEKFKQLLNF